MISEKVYQLTKAHNRRLKLRIDLLSFSYNVVASLEGNSIGGSIQIDANADIRRTANIQLVVTDSSFDIGEDKKIWLDKYIQIYMGLVDNNGETEWINMGIYLIDNPRLTYNSVTRTLELTAYDLMSKMTGLRNGQLEGIPNLVPAGSSIRGAMVSTVSQLGGFNKMIVQENPQDVPYDIQIDIGGYVYDIIAKLRDISAEWETYFDIDGIFHYNQISVYYDDEIIADDDILQSTVIQVENDVDFQNVKNVIEVFGKSIDPIRYGDVASLSGSTYSISLEDFTLKPNTTIGFTTPANNGTVSNAKLKINNLSALPILDEYGNNVTIDDSNAYLVVAIPSKLALASSSATATYSVNAVVNENGSYQLDIPALTDWTSGTVINMTMPPLEIVLNGTKTYRVSGTNIPQMGENVYYRITGASTAQKVSSRNATYVIQHPTAKGNKIYINIPDVNSLPTNTIINFYSPYINQSPTIVINNFSACQVYNGANLAVFPTLNTTYKITIPSITSVQYLGHQQTYGTISETNTESPYYIGKDIGEIRLICKNGEYNNIYSDSLAFQRAKYELYLHCRMEDTLTLTMIPIYWLDVNKKISYTYNGTTLTYVTKAINVDLSPQGTMTVNAIRFYPLLETIT